MSMARMAVALLGIMALFAAPTGSAAQQEQKPAAEEPKAEKPKAAKPKAPATRRHVGTVKAVDPAAGTLTVAEKGGDAEVTVGEKTTIKKGKETLTLSDLKPGDEVTVRYTKEEGKDVARAVTVKGK